MARVRNLAAVATPFGAGGDVDLDAFGAHLDWLAECGLDVGNADLLTCSIPLTVNRVTFPSDRYT